MPRRITQSYLDKTYWLATLSMLGVLALSAIVGSIYLHALQNNARYSAAFVELTEKVNELDRTLLHLSLVQGEGADTSLVLDELEGAALSLAEVYTALRMSDPDADDEEGNESENDENEMIEDLDLDLGAIQTRYGLTARGMPTEMVRIWESEEEDELAEEAAGDPAQADQDEPASLEDGVGDFLGAALGILSYSRGDDMVSDARIREAIAHFETVIRPLLPEITAAIRRSADQSANIAQMTWVAGAALCGLAVLANAMFLFRPMARSIMAYQTKLASERDRAISSEQAKKEFLAVMSHELRTPMNGVLGFAALILRTDLTQTQRDYVETIKSSGESLMDLLNSILDISKIEAGSMEPEPHPFSLHQTIDSAVQLLSAQAHEKKLEITHFVDADLPSELHGDSGLIRKLVLNLLGNAIKFTETGGVAIEVRAVDMRDQALMVEISVRDTGVGIPENKQALIFERFSQADASMQREFGGTGLGLTICKEIAHVMGGSISVESEPGQGSTFRAVLCLGKVTPEARSLREMTGCDLTGTRVLVVDDTPLNRRIATLQLENFGAQVVSADSAETALAELARAMNVGAPYDACMIDQMMPVTDGTTLLRMIRANERYDAMRTILSSSAGVRTDADAQKLGFDAAIPKPVQQQRLVERLASLTGRDRDEPDEAELDAMFGAADGRERGEGSAAPHVLIVDDNAANLKLACHILTNAGYTTDTAGNGAEAVKAAARFQYEAILMDLRMPVMDGLEASRRIRQLPGDRGGVPILAMTADVAELQAEALQGSGLQGLIPKPVDEKKLVMALNEVMQQPRGSAA